MGIKVSSDKGSIKFDYENEATPEVLSQYDFVLHGAATPLTKALDKHVKDWAKAQLANFAPVENAARVPASVYGTTPTAVDVAVPVVAPSAHLANSPK